MQVLFEKTVNQLKRKVSITSNNKAKNYDESANNLCFPLSVTSSLTVESRLPGAKSALLGSNWLQQATGHQTQ